MGVCSTSLSFVLAEGLVLLLLDGFEQSTTSQIEDTCRDIYCRHESVSVPHHLQIVDFLLNTSTNCRFPLLVTL